MLVDANTMKRLRLARNWTQQHLADVCGVSMRTIQRVEKDGVASNETVGAYASVFEIQVTELLLSNEQFDGKNRVNDDTKFPRLSGLIFIGGFTAGIVAGISLAAWLIQ